MTMFDPFREFQALRQEIDRAFAGDGGGTYPRMRLAFLPGRAARLYPLINLHDTGDDLEVEALVPGVEPDKMEVTVVGNTLTIAGEKPGFGNIPPERIHRSERAAGRFIRTFQLPAEIEPDRVNATYRNGLLHLTLPRSEASKPRRVMVQAGDGNGQVNQISSGSQQMGSSVEGRQQMGGSSESRQPMGTPGESGGGMPQSGSSSQQEETRNDR